MPPPPPNACARTAGSRPLVRERSCSISIASSTSRATNRVAAVWEHAREANRLKIAVRKFEPLPRRIAAGIREEAQDLGRFLGTADVDVRIG